MSALLEFLALETHPVVAALLAATARGVLLFPLAGLACLLWRRSAAARHLVSCATLLGLAVLPVLSAALPAGRPALHFTLDRETPAPPSETGPQPMAAASSEEPP